MTRAGSLLGAEAVPSGAQAAADQAKLSATLGRIRAVRVALLSYAVEQGSLPPTEEGLKAMVDAGILRREDIVDAWGRVAGVLPRSRLLQGLAASGTEAPVLDHMEREITSVAPSAPLEEILRQLQTRPGVPIVVVDGERLVRMITLENLAEFIEVSRQARPAR